MNKQHEIAKIQNFLKIPVTDIEFNNDNVQIKSGTKSIGGIPYYSVANILSYDTDVSIVNWLKWNEIYEQNKIEIDNLIIELFGTNEIAISLGTFRNLYVKTPNGEISSTVNCSFDNSWSITKIE